MRQLDPDRWEEVQRLFHLVVDAPPAERPELLAAACRDDALIADVMVLLAADAESGTPLDGDVSTAADAVLGALPIRGRRIGRYVLGEVIGEGGSAVVYRARREDLGNTVAIKVLRDAWVSPSRRERFMAEQRTLAALTHPSIARLLDANTLDDGTPYFVMEYVEGVPLTTHCRERRLPVRDRLRLLRSVCDAVQYAHAHAVVHRDIKPSNVLVTAAGEVRLLDFGIAKHLSDPDITATSGAALHPMTPAYAAPEQVSGGAVGAYTDVYALGAMLYELLTGERPRGPHRAGPFPVAGVEPAPPSELVHAARARRPRGAWADLDSLCMKALDEDPAQRYRSVEALARDIDHFLRGEPLEARPAALGYRAGKFVRRHRRAVTAVLAGAVLLVTVSGAYTLHLASARGRAEHEAAKARELADYLIGLFEAGDPYADEGGTDVRTLLDRGESRIGALDAQPSLQGELLTVLGRVRLSLSEYDRAEALLGRALALQRADPVDPVAVAATLVAQGRLHYHTGRFDEAHAALAEALALRQRHLPHGHLAVAEAYDELGVITSSRGDYVAADTLFRRGMEIRAAVHTAPHADLGISLNNIAVNEFNLGRYASAGAHYERALAVERAVYGSDHPAVATTLANYGKLHEQLGRFVEGEELLEEALRIRRARLGDDHYETVLSLSQLGGLLQQAGQLDRAERHLRDALAARERLLGGEHPGTATTLNAVGLLLAQRGDHVAAAGAFRRVVAIYGAALGRDHRFTGVALGNLGAALQAGGDHAAAEDAFRRSVTILGGVHPPDHPELAWNVGRLGMLLADRQRDGEAEPLLTRAHDALLAAHGAEHQRTRQTADSLHAVRRRLGR